MSTKNKGYLLPEILNPDTEICILVPVPNDPAYIRAVLGQLSDLGGWGMWEKEETHGAVLVASRWRESYARIMTCESCDGAITAITFDEDGIHYTVGGETFTVPNTDDILTEGDDCPCSEYPDQPEYEGTGDERSCNIANNLIHWLMEKYNDNIDKAETIENAMMAADGILALFPPAYLAWDALTDAVDEIFETGFSAARAADTVELREDMIETLYCLLLANGNEMSETVWGDFKAEFLGLIPDVLDLYFETFKYGAIENEARKASYGTSEGCETFECSGCAYMQDFALEDIGYFLDQGTWTSDDGGMVFKDAVAEDGNGAVVIVQFNFLAPITVSQIRFGWRATSTLGGSPPRHAGAWVRTWDGATWTDQVTEHYVEGTVENEWYERTETWAASEGTTIVELKLRCGWAGSEMGHDNRIWLDDICIQ